MLQKVIQLIDDGAVGGKGAAMLEAAAVQKKDCENQKPTDIQSREDEIKPKNSGRKSRTASSKITEKAFTSILSARSKVCFIIII